MEGFSIRPIALKAGRSSTSENGAQPERSSGYYKLKRCDLGVAVWGGSACDTEWIGGGGREPGFCGGDVSILRRFGGCLWVTGDPGPPVTALATAPVPCRSYDGHMFFFYFEARNDPENAPLILWMTGALPCGLCEGLSGMGKGVGWGWRW